MADVTVMQWFMAGAAAGNQGNLVLRLFRTDDVVGIKVHFNEIGMGGAETGQTFHEDVIDVIDEFLHCFPPLEARSQMVLIMTWHDFAPGSIWPLARSPRNAARPLVATLSFVASMPFSASRSEDHTSE